MRRGVFNRHLRTSSASYAARQYLRANDRDAVWRIFPKESSELELVFEKMEHIRVL